MFEIFKNLLSAFKSQPEQRRAEDVEEVVQPVAAADVPVVEKKTRSKKQMFDKKVEPEILPKKARKPRTPKVKTEVKE